MTVKNHAVAGLVAFKGGIIAVMTNQGLSAADEWHPPSWEEVVQEHFGRVYRLAFRLSGNQHDAEDITQEVFIRVFKSLKNFQPGSIEGWLHRITTNVFLDLVRRKKRIRMDPMGEEAAGYADRSDLNDPQRHFDYRNLDHDIQRALNDLAPQYRIVVVLCDIEGLSYEEIAQTLGVKLGTVRSRIHRARAKLRVSLTHLTPTEPLPAAASMDPTLSAAGGGQ